MNVVFDDMLRLLGEHCWAVPNVTVLHTLGGQPNVITVAGILKAAPGSADPAGVRAGLFEAAQRAIAAVEEAGYRHCRAPEIRIDGEAHGVYRPDEPVIVGHGHLCLTVCRPVGGVQR